MDVAFHCVLLLNSPTGGLQKGQLEGPLPKVIGGTKLPKLAPIDIRQFRTAVRRDASNDLWYKTDINKDVVPSDYVTFFPYAYPNNSITSYSCANGGYTLIAALNIIDNILVRREKAKKVSVGRVYSFSKTSDSSWKSKDSELVYFSRGQFTKIQFKYQGIDQNVEARIWGSLNATAAILALAFSNKEATILGHKDYPGFVLFSTSRFMLSCGYPDSLGPVPWYSMFANMARKFEYGKEFHNLFGILVLTRAYRPLFVTSTKDQHPKNAKDK
jgi:hypothetical protein